LARWGKGPEQEAGAGIGASSWRKKVEEGAGSKARMRGRI